jgi:hypothetical protein
MSRRDPLCQKSGVIESQRSVRRKAEEEMKLAICTAHYGSDSLFEATRSWIGQGCSWRPAETDCLIEMHRFQPVPVLIANGSCGMLPAYQRGFMVTAHDFDSGYYAADILAYLHDDLLIHDTDWISRVLKEFEDPQVGLVGFGGALGHGSPSLYREPYDYHQLGRSDFLSNMSDAEKHGKRFTGSCDVAVLDGFALIVRREVLEKAGGWNAAIELLSNSNSNEPLHHCYDYWLSCITRRLGYRIRLVGIGCTHKGGSTYVKLGVGKRESNWLQFLEAHSRIYDHFKDVLPARTNG